MLWRHTGFMFSITTSAGPINLHIWIFALDIVQFFKFCYLCFLLHVDHHRQTAKAKSCILFPGNKQRNSVETQYTICKYYILYLQHGMCASPLLYFKNYRIIISRECVVSLQTVVRFETNSDKTTKT